MTTVQKALLVTIVLAITASVGVLAATRTSGDTDPPDTTQGVLAIDEQDHPHPHPNADPADLELRPSSRGEPAPGLPGSANDGTDRRFVTPAPTAALVEWSDWCFFDVSGTGQATDYDCSSVYTTMAVALTVLEMDERCVLTESRARLEALAAISGSGTAAQIADVTGGYGWHRCPSPADPQPADDRSLAARCHASAPVAQWMDSRYDGGCTQWAQEQQELADGIYPGSEQSRRCFLAQALLIRWTQVTQPETTGFLWQC